ncbi:amino acid adenylation domain-containing protein [Acidithiobacillus ferrivorans]|uniref:amino acid adenylation domain-containing protein n=1 Tax=Acidithiobacillus ferrivorans TaxID=160808 RepID=UPI001C0745AB|nr:amino acid adenylation domain-containing protein [Acidithiobacillus ferrivorans]MBU2849930.1 amino acid adenylation domain-containing protein [Acidithiobacillus ferrivorans]
MVKANSFSCVLIGGQSILIQCARLLLEKGHRIPIVVTQDDSVLDWAKKHNTPSFNPDAELETHLQQVEFEYLFGIVNYSVLSSAILKLPKRGAINFHDGPLPLYAGRNVTSWALFNREREHGVTWHLMTEQVDRGDILKSRRIAISPSETALTLNAKCYEAGIEAFSDLVDELAEGRAKPVPQAAIESAKLYRRHQRPVPAGVIDCDESAENIEALFRALDYGYYPNPISVPKILLGHETLVARQIRILSHQSNAAPGTIIKANKDGLQLATSSHDVMLRDFVSLNGVAVSPAEAMARAVLTTGDRVPRLNERNRESLRHLDEHASRHEESWVQELARLEPVQISYINAAVSGYDGVKKRSLPMGTVAPPATLDHCEPGDRILAALAVYLARIGRKYEFHWGLVLPLPSDNVELTVALFERSVPLHTKIDSHKGFDEALRATIKQLGIVQTRGVYAKDLGLRYAELRRLNYPDFHVAVARVKALSDHRTGDSKSPLTIVIPDDGTECLWEYSEEAFNRSTIERMQEQFARLLDGLQQSAQRPVGRIPLLSQKEMGELLTGRNSTARPYPRQCVHALFEACARSVPDHVAVVFGDAEITYGVLDKRANRLAHYLRSYGLTPDSMVGLMVERSIDMVVAMLGILKAGAAYVPLDPAYPQDRLDFMVTDSHLPVIVTQRKLRTLLLATAANIIELNGDSAWMAEGGDSAPQSGVTTDHLAYVIYTSGSTGKPKGVMVEHGNVANFFAGIDDRIKHELPGTWLAVTSISFDISVLEILWSLCRGFKVLIYDGEVRNPSIADLIERHAVTHLQCTPSMARMLIADRRSRRALRSLDYMLVGGEALPLPLSAELRALVKGQVLNMYGPTETTIWSTTHRVNEEDIGCVEASTAKDYTVAKVVPIGRPISNTELYILDENLEPVPDGVAGELFIGGDGVVRGYLNRSELTDARFITNLFIDGEDRRLYRTGDLTRYRSDGIVEFLGRTDNQIKLRGYRIELGEVEAVLEQFPGVDAAAVSLQTDKQGDQRLVAYLAGHASNLSTGAIRAHVRMQLAEYMVPSRYCVLEVLPMTPNGKLDRNALLHLDFMPIVTKSDAIAPRTDTEKTLAQRWMEVLGASNVGVTDNFFEIGGDSLGAIHMGLVLSETFDVDLPFSTIFESPTLGELAAKIDSCRRERSSMGE